MRSIIFSGIALIVLSCAASAQGYPYRGPVYAAQRGLSPEEIRDHQRDQLDRRQEMERHALRMRQKEERRAFGFDD